MQIPYFSPKAMHAACRHELDAAWQRVLRQNWFVLGHELRAFEQEYAAFTGCRYCAGVGSGYDALLLILKALDLGKGDEIILPAHTFAACYNAVMATGAIPVLADVDPGTGLLTAETAGEQLDSLTRAIMPVHLYGQPCDLDSLLELAGQHGLWLVEDNAQAQGAWWGEKKTGSMGKAAATSFYPAKNLGALGDGGAITTNSQKLYERVLRLRNYGSSEKYYFEEMGVNSRLDELQAAFLRVKLQYLEQWNNERRLMARRYFEGLKYIGKLKLPVETRGGQSVYHIFNIRCQQRDALQRFLQKNGIGTLIHYPVPVHCQPAYRAMGYRQGDFPVAEEIARTSLSLPLYPGLQPAQQAFIIETVQEFFKKQG